jgi:RimJ/RimL family protein N-acetyltransferase
MLVGEKVTLGPLVQGDAPFLFSWLNNLELARQNGPYRPMDQIKFDQWFNTIGSDPSRVVFAIREVGDMRLIGYLQIINIQSASRVAEMGLMIGDVTKHGLGYGQEAVALAVKFCWRDLNLQRVSMFVVGDNPRAIRAYEKAGFEIEGTMRRAAFVDDQFQDMTIMGLLRNEGAA